MFVRLDGPSLLEEVITLSRRGGGRQVSDGGYRQVKV